jgi:mRNA interferase HigB
MIVLPSPKLSAKKTPEVRAWESRSAIVEAAAWRNPTQVRATFGTADFVGGKVVFNVGGNKYRLIAAISFEIRILSIEAVLTHGEYDKGKWK